VRPAGQKRAGILPTVDTARKQREPFYLTNSVLQADAPFERWCIDLGAHSATVNDAAFSP
jgi:hypothetical protein